MFRDFKKKFIEATGGMAVRGHDDLSNPILLVWNNFGELHINFVILMQDSNILFRFICTIPNTI